MTRLGIAAVAVGLLAFASLTPARAVDEFTPGSGAASATLWGINIPYGGANIGLGVGEANANYFENNATASAQTIDPGFLNIANIVKLCGSGYPTELPKPTTASTNDSGGQPDIHTKRAIDPGTGSESAEAYPGSRGQGDMVGQNFGFPGIAAMTGGRAQSEAKMTPADLARTASADVSISAISLLNGLVELGDLEWHIEQVATGVDSRTSTPAQTATFTVGHAKLGGLPLPTGTPDQLASSIDTINKAIGPIGLQLRLPRLLPNGSNGVRYSPMTVAIGGSTAYGKLLYPYIAGTNDTSVVSLFLKFTEPTIFDPANCNELAGLLKSNPQVNFLWNSIGVDTPVLLSAFAAALNGGAEVDFDFGGVRTTIDDTYYPPRVRPAPTPSAPPQVAAGAPPPAAAPEVAAPAVRPSTEVRTAPAASEQCATTSPVGRPACWRGIAQVAAGIAGVLTLALLGTDEFVRRRRLALSHVAGSPALSHVAGSPAPGAPEPST